MTRKIQLTVSEIRIRLTYWLLIAMLFILMLTALSFLLYLNPDVELPAYKAVVFADAVVLPMIGLQVFLSRNLAAQLPTNQ